MNFIGKFIKSILDFYIFSNVSMNIQVTKVILFISFNAFISFSEIIFTDIFSKGYAEDTMRYVFIGTGFIVFGLYHMILFYLKNEENKIIKFLQE